MEVKIHGIAKDKDGIHVTLSHPGAKNFPAMVFDKLPPEVAAEFFEHATKEEMDRMRGAPLEK